MAKPEPPPGNPGKTIGPTEQLKAELKKGRAEQEDRERKDWKELKERADREGNVDRQKAELAADEASNATPGGVGTAGQRESQCPFCASAAKVKDKSAGKYILSINLLFTKVTIKLPKILDFIPKILSYDANHKGQACTACGGKKSIKDVTDDTAKYQQIAQQTQQQAPEILEHESKLGEGNNRHTMVFGSDILQVGAVFNNNTGYRVEPTGGLVTKSLGGGVPQPEGAPCAKAVPIPGSLKWPEAIGNYVIQCANSFNLTVGGGGASISTKGNLDLKGGITTISAPQLTLAVERGPLTIGADSISLNAKYINVAPTAGTFFVKGSVHSSGNMIATGHVHAESISFVKAACCGVNTPTTMDQGNKDVSQSQPAIWGGIAAKGIITSLFDIQMFYADVPLNLETTATRLIGPAEMLNTMDRFKTMAKMCFPTEMLPTGICFTAAGPGVVFNFPHTHGLGAMNHTHNTRGPDLDYSADSPAALRGKVLHGGTYGNAPGDPIRDSLLKKIKALMETIGSILALPKQLIEEASKVYRFFF